MELSSLLSQCSRGATAGTANKLTGGGLTYLMSSRYSVVGEQTPSHKGIFFKSLADEIDSQRITVLDSERIFDMQYANRLICPGFSIREMTQLSCFLKKLCHKILDISYKYRFN